MDTPMKKRRTAALQVDAGGPLPELPAEPIAELSKGPTPGKMQDLILAFNKAGRECRTEPGLSAGGGKPPEQGNERNGAISKTGQLCTLLIPRHERRFAGFDECIFALYVHFFGLTDLWLD